MKLIIIESPYAGDVPANVAYAREAMLDSLDRGEAPMVAHLLYTQVLDDTNHKQREMGILSGIEWYRVAEACVIYGDLGITAGMQRGIERAHRMGVTIEYRTIR